MKELLDEIRARSHEVLAVVQEEQEVSSSDGIHERGDEGPAWLLSYAERGRHLPRNERRVGDRREFDKPDAVFEIVEHVSCKLQRQSRLACAARSGEGHEPLRTHDPRQLGQLSLAADELREL